MVSFEGTWHENDAVSKGQVIGYVGTTGASTGPHLHFQIDKDYSDYGGLHPWFPTDVNTIDTNGIVLNHSINPMKFVQDHSSASGGVFDPTNIYVSRSGNDASNGSLGAPFKTIQHAINMASAGGATIHIAPGTYGEKNSCSGKNIKFVVIVVNGNPPVRTGG